MNKHSGIAGSRLIIIVATLVVLGAVGYVVVTQMNDEVDSNTNATNLVTNSNNKNTNADGNVNATVNSNLALNTNTSNETADWQTYTNTDVSISGSINIVELINNRELSDVQSVWIARTPFDGKGTLNLLDLNTFAFTKTREYPFQGQNTDNTIISPHGERFVYHKVPSSEEELDIAGLYISDPFGNKEEKLASGFQCLDGPCNYDKSVWSGELSPSGNYLSYRKDGKMLVRNLTTGDEIETPVNEIPSLARMAQFSPSENFVIIAIPEGIMYGSLDGNNYRTIKREEGFLSLFSPDDHFILLAYNSTLLVLDSITGELINSHTHPEENYVQFGDFVWMTDTTFVYWYSEKGKWYYSLYSVNKNELTADLVGPWEGNEKEDVQKIVRLDNETVLFEMYSNSGTLLKRYNIHSSKEPETVFQASHQDTLFFDLLGPNN